MHRNYNFLHFFVLLTVLVLTGGCGLQQRPAGDALPYAEGGPVTDDPGQGLAARYVDHISGNDTADGVGPATAWQSLDKAAAALATLPPGAHLLFKRGGAWEGDPTFDKIHGSEDSGLYWARMVRWMRPGPALPGAYCSATAAISCSAIWT
jgi:hypothetical protein